MPSARILDAYRRRLRALEAAYALAAASKHQQLRDEGAYAALRDGPPLSWNQPVRCRDGVGRYLVVCWQPWMGSKAHLIALIDAAELAGHGVAPLGISPAQRLSELNAEIAQVLCSGPEGAAWVQRLADAAQAAAAGRWSTTEHDRVGGAWAEDPPAGRSA